MSAGVELVYIGAAWCATCKTIKPELVELCKKFSVSMTILDYDKDLDEDAQAEVSKVPTVRIFKADAKVAEFNAKQVARTMAWFAENVTLGAVDDF